MDVIQSNAPVQQDETSIQSQHNYDFVQSTYHQKPSNMFNITPVQPVRNEKVFESPFRLHKSHAILNFFPGTPTP